MSNIALGIEELCIDIIAQAVNDYLYEDPLSESYASARYFLFHDHKSLKNTCQGANISYTWVSNLLENLI